MLHQEPGPAAGQSPGQVAAEGQFGRLSDGPIELITLGEVVVLGDQVLLAGPLPVIHPGGPGHHHEIRGHRDSGGQSVQQITLGDKTGQQFVRTEPGEIQGLGRVRPGGGLPGRQDLLPVVVPLAPEGRPPGGIQGFQVAVALPQPAPERGRRDVAVAVRVVAAQFVGDVPHRQRRMPGVPGGQRLDQVQGLLAEHRRTGAEVLPATRPEPVTGLIDDQRLRVGPGEPGRWGRRRGGQIDRDAMLFQQVENPVEPAEAEYFRGRLQPGPGEHPDGDETDPGFLHQPGVLRPDRLGPLLGVVVAAQGQTRQRPAGRARVVAHTLGA